VYPHIDVGKSGPVPDCTTTFAYQNNEPVTWIAQFMSTPLNSEHGTRESSAKAALISGAIDTAVTLAAFMAARSSVILADFLKTILEFAAVWLAWYTVQRVRRGADHEFQYGVGKLEHLSSLFVGVLMITCLVIIVVNATRNVLHPSHIGGLGVWISIAAQSVFAVINGRLYWRTDRVAKAESSPVMASQARLLLSRFVANAFILIALVLSMAFQSYPWAVYIDPLASLVIAAFIFFSASGLFASSINDLLDRALEEKSQIIILRELVRFFADYEQIHGIRTRRSGSQVFIEVFLEFAPEKTVAQVQPVMDNLSECLEKSIPGSRVAVVMTTKKVN
jgi:ferrous-iron efflux pump FieF